MEDETLVKKIEELAKTEIKNCVFRNQFNEFISGYRKYQKAHTKYLNSR